MTTGDWQQDRIVIDDLGDAIDTPAVRAAALDWWHKVVDSTARQRAHGVEPVVIMSKVRDEDLALVERLERLDLHREPLRVGTDSVPVQRATLNAAPLTPSSDALAQAQAALEQAQQAHSHAIHDPVVPDVYAIIGRERGVNVRPGLAKRVNETLAKHVAGVALTRALRFR